MNTIADKVNKIIMDIHDKADFSRKIKYNIDNTIIGYKNFPFRYMGGRPISIIALQPDKFEPFCRLNKSERMYRFNNEGFHQIMDNIFLHRNRNILSFRYRK